NQTVAKLVAASERPDVQYRVTILNSDAVNAFALPTGQLYVTRGLIALASDTSELASVLSHEMSHVIARHAAIREDQERRVAMVRRGVRDVASDPETGALALAKSKIALASFSRAQEFEADGIGVGMAARAGYDPYGAARFLSSMGRNAELKSKPSQSHIDPGAPDFLSSHPATPERIRNAQPSGRHGAPRSRAPPVPRPRGAATPTGGPPRQPRRHGLRRGPERRLRARPPLPAPPPRLHLPGAGRIRARQHRAGGSRRQGRRRPS